MTDVAVDLGVIAAAGSDVECGGVAEGGQYQMAAVLDGIAAGDGAIGDVAVRGAATAKVGKMAAVSRSTGAGRGARPGRWRCYRPSEFEHRVE